MRPLHHAACLNDLEVMRLLVASGADKEAARSFSGRRALHLAAAGPTIAQTKLAFKPADAEVREGHSEVVRFLLDSGAKKEAADFMGSRPLHWAAMRGSAEIVGLLLNLGVDVEATDSMGCRAMHWAAMRGFLDVLRLLLAAGADFEATNLKDPAQRRPLLWAALGGHSCLVRLLLESGANKEVRSSDGSSALHLAAKGGHVKVVQVLLDFSAARDAVDHLGRSACELAAGHGHHEAAKLIGEKRRRLSDGSKVRTQGPHVLMARMAGPWDSSSHGAPGPEVVNS